MNSVEFVKSRIGNYFEVQGHSNPFPAASVMPQIAVKKYSRSYGEGERGMQRFKDASNKLYNASVVEWLLAN